MEDEFQLQKPGIIFHLSLQMLPNTVEGSLGGIKSTSVEAEEREGHLN
jgi:hypothetical protein